MTDDNKTVTIELTEEQYAFLTKWQKTHEAELGIEVPLTSMIRKAIDGAMKAQNKPEREDRPARSFGDKPSFGGQSPRKSFGDKPSFGGPRKSFGDKPSFGGDRGDRPSRPSFGAGRPSFGGGRPAGRGPKFDMSSVGVKKRKFD